MNELDALAQARWADFNGLAGCTLAVADALLGRQADEPLHSGMFGGEPARFRRYPGGPAAPRGVTCWVQGDQVIGVEIREPAHDPATLAALDPADLLLDSGLGSGWTQAVWATRGLVLHLREGAIALALGLAPIDPEAWPDDPLRWWRDERRRG